MCIALQSSQLQWALVRSGFDTFDKLVILDQIWGSWLRGLAVECHEDRDSVMRTSIALWSVQFNFGVCVCVCVCKKNILNSLEEGLTTKARVRK